MANVKPLFNRFAFVAPYLKHCGLLSGLFHLDSLLTVPEPPVSSGGFSLNLSKLYAFLFERLFICNQTSVLFCYEVSVKFPRLEN